MFQHIFCIANCAYAISIRWLARRKFLSRWRPFWHRQELHRSSTYQPVGLSWHSPAAAQASDRVLKQLVECHLRLLECRRAFFRVHELLSNSLYTDSCDPFPNFVVIDPCPQCTKEIWKNDCLVRNVKLFIFYSSYTIR